MPINNAEELPCIESDDFYKFLTIGASDVLALDSKNVQKLQSLMRPYVLEGSYIVPKVNPAYCDSLHFKSVRNRRWTPKTPIRWNLPGHGEGGEDCGGYRSSVVCVHGDNGRIIKNHCWKASCPHCAFDWASRKAKQISEKLEALQELYADEHSCLQHWVVSPPQEVAMDLATS